MTRKKIAKEKMPRKKCVEFKMAIGEPHPLILLIRLGQAFFYID